MSLKSPSSFIANRHSQLQATARIEQWDHHFQEAKRHQARDPSSLWASLAGKGGFSSDPFRLFGYLPKQKLQAPETLGSIESTGQTVFEVVEGDTLPMIATDAQRQARAQRFKDSLSPVSRNGGFDLVSSPSRGNHLASGVDITEKSAQERFRDMLQSSVDRYKEKYAEEELAGLYDGPQREELLNILLEFRKLREGLIAAKRNDDFAIEVYETSIELAIQAANFEQLASALPALVYELHAAKVIRQSESESEPNSSLIDGMHALSIQEGSASGDQRALFASYLLLTQIAGASKAGGPFDSYRSKFWAAFRMLTVKPVDLYDRDFPVLSASHPHLQLALAVYRSVDQSNWARLRALLEEGTGDGERTTGQLILIRGCVERVRTRVFEAALTAYVDAPASFVVKMLCFNGWWSNGAEEAEGEDELINYLQQPPNGLPALVGDHNDLYHQGSATVPLKRAVKALDKFAPPNIVSFLGSWPLSMQKA